MKPPSGTRNVGAVSAGSSWTLSTPLFGLISRFPDSGTRVPGLPLDLPVRRAPVTRFPFHVVYIDRDDVIRVLAFAHDRRSPDYWRSRVSQ